MVPAQILDDIVIEDGLVISSPANCLPFSPLRGVLDFYQIFILTTLRGMLNFY